MIIVIDSNVLFSAFLAKGICSEILEIVLSKHELVLSENILSEIENNLINKINLPKDIVKEYINLLKLRSEIVLPAPIAAEVCRDKNDLVIIGAAVKGKAEIIITGDKDLLVIKKYKDILIISPKESLGLINQ